MNVYIHILNNLEFSVLIFDMLQQSEWCLAQINIS